MNIQTYRVRGIDLEHDGERFPRAARLSSPPRRLPSCAAFLSRL